MAAVTGLNDASSIHIAVVGAISAQIVITACIAFFIREILRTSRDMTNYVARVNDWSELITNGTSAGGVTVTAWSGSRHATFLEWPSFLVGAICGVAAMSIARSISRSQIFKTLQASASPLLAGNSFGMNSTKPIPRTHKKSSKRRHETTKRSASNEYVEEATHLPEVVEDKWQITLTSPSASQAAADLKADSVQLDDISELDGYSYQHVHDDANEPGQEFDSASFNQPELQEIDCQSASDSVSSHSLLDGFLGYDMDLVLKVIQEYFTSAAPSPTTDDGNHGVDPYAWIASESEHECRAICHLLRSIALRFAIKEGSCALVEQYIGMAVAIEWDTIKLAITCNQLEVLRLFFTLDKVSDSCKSRVLEEAACQGRLEIMEFMIDNQFDVNGTKTTNPLKAAAAAGQLSAVKKLLQKGADIEARHARSMVEQPNRTPLVAATARNHAAVVKALVKAGAKIDDGAKAGNAPIHVAMKKGHSRMVSLLFSLGAKLDKSKGELERALELAVESNDVQLAAVILRAGADVNTDLENFGSFLQLAAANGNETLVRLLIKHGASISKIGSTNRMGGNCALMAATSSGRAKVVRILLKHNATVDGAYGIFGNILQTASYLGYSDVVQAVLEMKPDVDVNGTGRIVASPLCMAMQYHWKVLSGEQRPAEGSDHIKVMRVLLDNGGTLSREDVALWEQGGGIPVQLLDILRSIWKE